MTRTLRIGCGAGVLAMALCVAASSTADVGASGSKASSLDELLEQVRTGWDAERRDNERREAEFRSEKADHQRLLSEAEATLAALEQESETLEKAFGDKELRLADLEELLKEKLGTLGELFGVVRQVSGDTAGHLESSLVSAQLPGRAEFLAELGQSKALPSIEKLRRLWYEMQREMTQQGKIARFSATVTTVNGEEEEREVVRAGIFNAVSAGKYLSWRNGKLIEFVRQPAARHLAGVRDFEATTADGAPLSIDPSRGAILSLLVQTPSARERIEQGGYVGYAIITLGVLAGLLGLARFAYLLIVRRKVRAQQDRKEIRTDNPLGRVLDIYEQNRDDDPETLELELDEAILRESARLDRFLWLIKVVSVVAPLMGLLGTVTGMIQTFQSIVLFGTGDPKMMAGGISEALITTMLGLCVAIPLVLLHAIMSSSSRGVVELLQEQSAGLVAMRAKKVAV